MAYQKLYYYEFYRLRSTEKHTVEIWKNTTETITAEEIKGSNQPFKVEMPELDHKFQVVKGSGCTISILSDTDSKFFASLYHVGYNEIMIKHYIDGALNWLGYLDSEMFSEPYDQNKNYIVSANGCDGFALMERFSFVDENELKFAGIKSKIEILQICLNKIGLPWTYFNIGLSTTFTGYSGDADSSILHESYVNCANFYDEDEKPMTIREVIETILAPYGAFIESKGSVIYVTDMHAKASGTAIPMKSFDYSDFSYYETISVDFEKEVSDIGYFGTGQNREISGGKNRQEVIYSPYPIENILDESLTGVAEFTTVPDTFSQKNGYYYKQLDGNKYWNRTTIIVAKFQASYYGYGNEQNTDVYLQYIPLYDQKMFACKLRPFLTITGAASLQYRRNRYRYTDGLALLITGEVLVMVDDNPYYATEQNKHKHDIHEVFLKCKCKIGSYSVTEDHFFEPGDNYFFVYAIAAQNDTLSNKFVSFSDKIVLGKLGEEIIFSGNFDFEIWGRTQYTFTNGDETSDNPIENSDRQDIKEIWIKNLSIKLINYDGTEIEKEDVKYIGVLNKYYANEAEKIELKCGTDSQFSDKGKIMYKDESGDYRPIRQWTRNSQTFCIEKLLLASLSSNYQAGYITLSGMKLKSVFGKDTIITDSYMPTKKLMVNSIDQDFYNNVNECSLVEIMPDSLTIVEDATLT